jgi:predicted acylesterase/phospholipase RssA
MATPLIIVTVLAVFTIEVAIGILSDVGRSRPLIGQRTVNVQIQPDVKTVTQHLPFTVVALVLQGGGAIRAYQAGVYEALDEAGIHPNWIAGVSIGAINAALIPGNPPKDRVDRLREFWTLVTSGGCWPWFGDRSFRLSRGDAGRNFLNQMSAGVALTNGARDFFKTRPVGPWFQPARSDPTITKASLLSILPRTDVNRSDRRVSAAPTPKDTSQSQ